MLNNIYLAYALIAVGIFTFYMALMHLLRPATSRSRVRAFAQDAAYNEQASQGQESTPLIVSFTDTTLGTFNIDTKNQRELTLQLSRAGLNSPHAASYYLFSKWFIQPLIILGGIVFIFSSISHPLPTSTLLSRLFAAILLIIGGIYGGRIYIYNAKKKRQQILLYSFPEMLDLLLVCIESGLGLDAALNRVCAELRELHPETVSELDRTRLELTMLNDRVTALENLSERAEIIPFRTLVSSLIQTERFGTSLVDTLRVLSEEQRITRLFIAEQKAARIPVLITIPLILFIMPAFVMVILGPPIIRVMEQGGLFGHQNGSPKQ